MTTPGMQLELLSPWALASDMTLPAHCHAPARQVLLAVLCALESPPLQAREQLTAAALLLPDADTNTLQIEHTKTSLSTTEVNIYDGYFALHHVSSDIPGITLMKGLLTMLQRFVDLCEQMDNADARSVNDQKNGLRSYTHLLARVFKLEPLT